MSHIECLKSWTVETTSGDNIQPYSLVLAKLKKLIEDQYSYN